MEKFHNSHSIKKKKHNYLTPPNSPFKSVSLKNSLINNSELLKFISSGLKNKINFTSVFDYKGSKNFLQSKNIALQEILVNDDEIGDIENNNVKKENSKIIQIYEISEFSNKRKSEEKKCLTPEKLYGYQNENTKSNKSKNKKKEKSSKNKGKIKKPMTDKFLWSYKIDDINDELSKNKNGKITKTPYEIKMFKDKDIKDIEPIKKTKQNKSNYNFVKIDSEENDLSLFNMINQL